LKITINYQHSQIFLSPQRKYEELHTDKPIHNSAISPLIKVTSSGKVEKRGMKMKDETDLRTQKFSQAMRSSRVSLFSLCMMINLALCLLSTTDGFGTTPTSSSMQHSTDDARRSFLSNTFATAATFFSMPSLAIARYVLNEETGEYDEVTDEDWQTTWKKRLDKAQSMGTEDVFLAAQGAGNLDLKNDNGVDESDASKKRRAMAGCRNDRLRAKSGVDDVKECTKRVLSGDYQFMIGVM
jgi:hypothetical protein